MTIYNSPSLKSRRRLLRRNFTDAERLLWSKLRNRQLLDVKFFRQYSVGPYVLDFYAPAHRLGIEFDGGQHLEPPHEEHDRQRTAYLNRQDINVIRFWNNDVLANIDGVVEQIEYVLFQTPPNLPLHQGEETLL